MMGEIMRGDNEWLARQARLAQPRADAKAAYLAAYRAAMLLPTLDAQDAAIGRAEGEWAMREAAIEARERGERTMAEYDGYTISVRDDLSALWGDQSGMDVLASEARYQEIVTQRLAELVPGAEIRYRVERHGVGVQIDVDGPDRATRDAIERLIRADMEYVYEAGDWAVLLAS